MTARDFRAAVEARDRDRMVAALADDVVLHSPVTFRPFEGREAVSVLFTVLLEVFEDFRYGDELEGDSLLGLVFHARVGDRDVEGIDLLRLGEDGRVADLTVMVRPLSAVQALAAAVGERLAAR